MSKLRITIYCPDRHLAYNGATPDAKGVGGGITARIRLAAGLARRGHGVTVLCNTPEADTIGGVHYVPLDAVRRIDADLLVLHSTGDKLDLRPVLDLPVEARLRIVLVDGFYLPGGLHEVGMDVLCACSNFIRTVAIEQWRVPAGQIFVSHHGVDRSHYDSHGWRSHSRNPYRIAYATHPSKGLEAAMAVLRLLRAQDPRFELHVFGGNGLWGQKQEPEWNEPGVVFRGLVGQRVLAGELLECGVALYLQSRREPFGIAIAEALAAGAIPLASPAGAHPEIIDHGRTGFLVDGDPEDERTHQRAAETIRALAANPDFCTTMRMAAQAAPLDWDQIALTWEQYAGWLLAGRGGRTPLAAPPCPGCGGAWLLLADGYHCQNCGIYSRDGRRC